MIPASAMECNCDQCGAEFYIGRTSPKRFDDYLWPGYCPVCGASKSLTGITVTSKFKQADASRAVDFEDACAICGRTLKEHSIEGVKACGRKRSANFHQLPSLLICI